MPVAANQVFSITEPRLIISGNPPLDAGLLSWGHIVSKTELRMAAFDYGFPVLDLNIHNYINNVTRACKLMDTSRDTF